MYDNQSRLNHLLKNHPTQQQTISVNSLYITSKHFKKHRRRLMQERINYSRIHIINIRIVITIYTLIH